MKHIIQAANSHTVIEAPLRTPLAISRADSQQGSGSGRAREMGRERGGERERSGRDEGIWTSAVQFLGPGFTSLLKMSSSV